MQQKACRNCRRVIEQGEKCPNCQGSAFTTFWRGYVMIRDSEKQKELGIPEEYLSGHGWHNYILKSKDGTVKFQFTHNVNGRDIYALGTLDAVRFLHKKFYQENKRGEIYSMIDVLKN